MSRNSLRLALSLVCAITPWLALAGPAIKVSTPPAVGAAPGSVDAVDDLKQRLAPLTTLSARFVQTVYAADGHELQATSGDMKLARPGKVRWISAPPFEQWVVADGETLWVYDPDLQQVSVRPFLGDVGNTPAVLFIGGIGELERQFSVARKASGATLSYTLKPLAADSRYTELTLSFSGEIPTAMVLRDSLGQRTEMTFAKVVLNAPVDAALFHFDPPPGTDVLRETANPD